MDQTTKTDDELQEHLETRAESTDPDYLAWKEQKIKTGLEQSKDRASMIPASKVWEKLGLER